MIPVPVNHRAGSEQMDVLFLTTFKTCFSSSLKIIRQHWMVLDIYKDIALLETQVHKLAMCLWRLSLEILTRQTVLEWKSILCTHVRHLAYNTHTHTQTSMLWEHFVFTLKLSERIVSMTLQCLKGLIWHDQLQGENIYFILSVYVCVYTVYIFTIYTVFVYYLCMVIVIGNTLYMCSFESFLRWYTITIIIQPGILVVAVQVKCVKLFIRTVLFHSIIDYLI